MTLCILMDQAVATGAVDVAGCVKKIIERRPQLVENEVS